MQYAGKRYPALIQKNLKNLNEQEFIDSGVAGKSEDN